MNTIPPSPDQGPKASLLNGLRKMCNNPFAALLLSALGGACTGQKDADASADTGGTEDTATDTDTGTEPFVPATGTVVEPRTSEHVFHPSIHLFTNYSSVRQIQEAVAAIKQALFADRDAATCYENGEKRVQFAIQTEYIPQECADQPSMEACFAQLDERLDAITNAGFAVQLLLSVHQVPSNNWLGVDWEASRDAWSKSSTFLPYEPTLTNVGGPYDVLSEQWQVLLIKHLKRTGRLSKIAVIYLMNEPGTASANASDQAALAATLGRLLDNARAVSDGTPVGFKLARPADTGWNPPRSKDPDQLALTLELLQANGDHLGYDVYGGPGNWDTVSCDRLTPLIGGFTEGRFAISEFGRECTGSEGGFTSGSRTEASDFTELMAQWPLAKSINAFGWNPSGSWAGCYAIYDDAKHTLYPGAEDTLQGLWGASAFHLGTSTPAANPCTE